MFLSKNGFHLVLIPQIGEGLTIMLVKRMLLLFFVCAVQKLISG